MFHKVFGGPNRGRSTTRSSRGKPGAYKGIKATLSKHSPILGGIAIGLAVLMGGLGGIRWMNNKFKGLEEEINKNSATKPQQTEPQQTDKNINAKKATIYKTFLEDPKSILYNNKCLGDIRTALHTMPEDKLDEAYQDPKAWAHNLMKEKFTEHLTEAGWKTADEFKKGLGIRWLKDQETDAALNSKLTTFYDKSKSADEKEQAAHDIADTLFQGYQEQWLDYASGKIEHIRNGLQGRTLKQAAASTTKGWWNNQQISLKEATSPKHQLRSIFYSDDDAGDPDVRKQALETLKVKDHNLTELLLRCGEKTSQNALENKLQRIDETFPHQAQEKATKTQLLQAATLDYIHNHMPEDDPWREDVRNERDKLKTECKTKLGDDKAFDHIWTTTEAITAL